MASSFIGATRARLSKNWSHEVRAGPSSWVLLGFSRMLQVPGLEKGRHLGRVGVVLSETGDAEEEVRS